MGIGEFKEDYLEAVYILQLIMMRAKWNTQSGDISEA